MKIIRIILLALALVLMLSSIASAHQYHGHYSVYYGSGYRQFHSYHHYGPAVYQYRPYQLIEWSYPRMHQYRYIKNNYDYNYVDPYYTHYRYIQSNNNRNWRVW